MRRTTVLLAFLLVPGCAAEPELTPAQRAAQDRSECQALATSQSGFDPPKQVDAIENKSDMSLGHRA